MLSAICRNEWRALHADRAWIWAIGLFAVFAAHAAHTGSVWRTERQNVVNSEIAKRDQRRQEQLETLRKATAKPPAAAMPYGPRDTAVLPPTPLAVLSVGQADLQPFIASIGLFVTPRTSFLQYDTQNPATLSSGRFDLAFVLTYLFPLLILAVTYSVVSAEREQGTLAMTLAQPVTLRSLALGKITVRGAAVILPVILITVFAVVLTGGSHAPALLVLALVASILIYGLFWLALAGLINALRTSSAANALTLGTAWLGLVVVVPALLNLLMQNLYLLPPRPSMTNQARAALVESEKRGAQVLGSLYQLHPELKPASTEKGPIADSTRQYYAVLQEGERQTAEMTAAFEQRLRQRQEFVSIFRFLSPAVVFRTALSDIAGNGPDRFAHFGHQVHSYQERWRDSFAPRMFQNTLLSAADFEWVPRFRYSEEPLASRLPRLLVNLFGIAIPTAVVLLLCQRILSRKTTIF